MLKKCGLIVRNGILHLNQLIIVLLHRFFFDILFNLYLDHEFLFKFIK